MKRKPILLLVLVTVLVLSMVVGAAGCSKPAKYPTKAIDLVVPLPAGGGVDLGARVIAKFLSAELKVPVNVINKAGGNQVPGVVSTLQAQADGYTLLADSSAHGTLHMILKDAPYKLEDRTFVARVMGAPSAFFVSGKSSFNSLKDVIDAAKKDPANFSWCWLGGNTTTDFALLKLFSENGIEISKTKRVPFQGSGPAVTAVAGNQVMFGAGGASAVFALAKSGDLRVLAVTGDKRLPSLSQVATTKEIGMPNVDVGWWVGISGPKNMPKDVVDTLAAAAKKISEDPELTKQLEAIGAYPAYLDPAQMKDFELKEAASFKELQAKVGSMN